jgi:hypothetical protein
MSPTPPISSTGRPTAGQSTDSESGDSIKLDVVAARGAQRTGAIWILVISLALAIVVIGVYWLSQAPKMQAVNHPSGQDLSVRDVNSLYRDAAHPSKLNNATTTGSTAGAH